MESSDFGQGRTVDSSEHGNEIWVPKDAGISRELRSVEVVNKIDLLKKFVRTRKG